MDHDLKTWGYANHDAIMVAIRNRGRWVRAEMDRRWRMGMVIMAANGIASGIVIMAGYVPMGVFHVCVAVVAGLGGLWAARPEPLRRRWNDENTALGAYLAALDEERA